MTSRFKARFGPLVPSCIVRYLRVRNTMNGEKFNEGEVKVVVGARSAIFAPFENIGIIILDEEHESTYKQEDTPRYHARDVAIKRAEYYRLSCHSRQCDAIARIICKSIKRGLHIANVNETSKKPGTSRSFIVDMREELKSGNRSMFSVAISGSNSKTIRTGEQSILFLIGVDFPHLFSAGIVERLLNARIAIFH